MKIDARGAQAGRSRLARAFIEEPIAVLKRSFAVVAAALLLPWTGASAGEQTAPAPEHPFLLFDAGAVAALRQRAGADTLLKYCLDDVRKASRRKPGEENYCWQETLEDQAFLATLENDPELTKQAVEFFRAMLREHDPAQFFAKAGPYDNWYGRTPRAFALAWDWLAPRMTQEQKSEALPQLEAWCVRTYEHTDKQWWAEASYNVGVVPVAACGLLALALRGDTSNAAIETCYREAVRRVSQNYYPTAWKPSGICYEGPCYACTGLDYAGLFTEAVWRAGGGNLALGSGADQALRYLMYQELPWGGCAPIGDNTGQGGRTFSAQYLADLGKTGDAAGLWTWRKYTATDWLDTLTAYLGYPLDLKPRSPREMGTPTSRYFEVTPNRAGYVFARSVWDDTDAAFFAFVTRFEQCNHQHYDMDSFLFGGFGTLFATHQMLFPYESEKHGVDYEHNLIIINGGGWPATNRTPRSCGIDNSTEGLLVGLALSNFADYVRGDAKWSYRDNSVATSNPAIRAERTCLFAKHGATPYLLIVDDNQQLGLPVKYEWLWHAPNLPMHGAGAPADPLVMTAKGGTCAVQFIQPAQPALTKQPVNSSLVRLRVEQTGVRVRYAAIATLQREENARPRAAVQAVECRNASAFGVSVELADGSRDLIAWQSEEDRVQRGHPLAVGSLRTDGLLAMVRVANGKVTGFVLGEGTYLRWDDTWLVKAESSVNVSAGAGDRQISGRLRNRQALPPAPAGAVQVMQLGQ